MVSVVAEKEFRIPNPKCIFPINAGRTGRRLSHGKAIVRFIRFVLLSICFLNNNGGLFRQTGAQRPRAGVSVGHTDVRHSLISAVGAHPSASDVVCGGNLCASLAAGRIGLSHPLLALILKNHRPFLMSRKELEIKSRKISQFKLNLRDNMHLLYTDNYYGKQTPQTIRPPINR